MKYSDRDLLVATQIAYYDFDKDIINRNSYTATLRELLLQDDTEYNKLLAQQAAAKSPLEKSRAASAMDLYNEIISDNSKYGDWVIKNVKNDNADSGFYGCLIETNDKSAIVAFRGSESDGDQIQKDWEQADIGLLNSRLTGQQKVAEQYMSEINEKYHYSNYATSGHSLGGNLSAHATITAPEGMCDKITQSISFDGPGFSDEYLKVHAAQIEHMSGKMTHYQWSVVGSLLFSVPGADYQTIRTNDKVYGKYDFGSLTQKHDTSFVLFDANGNVVPGTMDNFAKSVGRLTRETDSCPSCMGNALAAGICKIMNMTDEEKANAGKALIAGLGAYAATHPLETAVIVPAGLIAAAGLATVGWIDPDFYFKDLIPFLCDATTVTAEVGKRIVDGIVKVVATTLAAINLAANLVTKIVNGVAGAISAMISWFNKTFNAGYQYAVANPAIKLNTYSLRKYADDLNRINSRIFELDSRLSDLYWQVGFLDLLNIIQADLLVGYSWRLTRCADYLIDTATDFENVERNIMSKAL